MSQFTTLVKNNERMYQIRVGDSIVGHYASIRAVKAALTNNSRLGGIRKWHAKRDPEWWPEHKKNIVIEYVDMPDWKPADELQEWMQALQ